MVPVSPDFAEALNAMMRRDLDNWSTCWFWGLIASTVLVVVGLLAELPEVWAEVVRPAWNWVRNFWKTRIKAEEFDGWERISPELRALAPTELSRGWKALIGATALLGWMFVAIGVAGEGVAEYFVNDAETSLRVFDQAVQAETQRSANSAAAASALANVFADKATLKSGNAMALAKGARTEADSFEQDIKSAKEQAAEAESHLAQATKSANILTAKLERLTTPRKLPYSAQLIAALKRFPGTEYVFIGSCPDQECFDLLANIDGVLKLAGWKRVKGPPLRIGIAQFMINGDKDFSVDASVSTGLAVSIQTPNGMESVNGLTEDQWPQNIRAAVLLNGLLAANISPPENTDRKVSV